MALSLALTPSLAVVGRVVAGRLRRSNDARRDQELQVRGLQPPVVIVGMGRIGRGLADALHAFDIGYSAVERDQRRLSEAVADGYDAMFGDMVDLRLWDPSAMHGRRVVVLTAASYEEVREISPVIRQRYPELLQYVLIADAAEAERFHEIGLHPIVERGTASMNLVAAVLGSLGVGLAETSAWVERRRERARGEPEAVAVAP